MTRTAAVVGAVLALVLTACTADEGAPAAEERASAGTTDTPSETPSETPSSETPSETPGETPTVEPATGPLVEVSGVSIRLPQGWKPAYVTSVSGSGIGRNGQLLLSVLAARERPLRAMMAEELRLFGEVRRVRRLPDTTLGGSSAYEYTGWTEMEDQRFSVGAWDDGYEVFVRVDVSDSVPASERRELFESVIATYSS